MENREKFTKEIEREIKIVSRDQRDTEMLDEKEESNDLEEKQNGEK